MIDAQRDQLQEEAYLYQFLSRLFLTEPSMELLTDLAGVSVPREDNDAIGCGLRRLGEAARQNAGRLAAWQEELAIEYARLFIGPQAPPAVPYASFYLSETRSLMTDETIAVRKNYLEGGVVLKNLYQVPDDHIGIELEFIYHLIREAETATQAGCIDEAEKFVQLRDKFISDHFLCWAPIFAGKMREATQEDFYRAASQLLLGVAHHAPCL